MDEPQNNVLEHLRAPRAQVAAVRADTREIKSRVTIFESGVASLRRDDGYSATNIAANQELGFA